MTINDIDIDFKITKISDAEKFETAIKNLAVNEQKAQLKRNDGSLVTALKSLIEVMQVFFIEATGVDVLAGCDDLQVAKETYIQFLAEIEEQKGKYID